MRNTEPTIHFVVCGTWNEIEKKKNRLNNAIDFPVGLLHDMTITWLDHSTVSHIWPARATCRAQAAQLPELPTYLSVCPSVWLSLLSLSACLFVLQSCHRQSVELNVVASRRQPSAGASSSSSFSARTRSMLNKEKYLCVDQFPNTYTPAGLHNTAPWKAKNFKFKSNSKSKSSSHHFMMKNVQDSNSGASIGIG